MEALLSWRGVMFLTYTHLCTEARTYCRYAVVHHANAQADTCAHTQPTCVYPQTDIYTRSLSSFHAGVRCMWVCIFSHGICWYSFSKPLAAWCVQLHCQFISLPTQQSLISPSGSYTAQHMIALHRGVGGYFRRHELLRGGSKRPSHRSEKM